MLCNKTNIMNLDFLQTQLGAFISIMILMTSVWIYSVIIKNASIVDIFWGTGFIVAAFYYFFNTDGLEIRKLIVLLMTSIWGLRLTIYILIRNFNKGEDFRYQQFRKDYGPKRYWWFSFFQVFLLQGFLAALISAPLLGSMFYSNSDNLGILDYIGISIWIVGFTFEAGGDFQLARFKKNKANKSKLLTSGFWKYTRHPNYFGDSAVWWGFGVMSIAGGSYLAIIGSVIMTFLLLRISGVSLLERTLKNTKPGYENYMKSTNSFFPWFPKKVNN
jgi:steroid 5-alpha reductase family enzyme